METFPDLLPEEVADNFPLPALSVLSDISTGDCNCTLSGLDTSILLLSAGRVLILNGELLMC